MSKLDHFSNAELSGEDLDAVSGGNWWCHPWKNPCDDRKDHCDWDKKDRDCRDDDHDRKRKHCW